MARSRLKLMAADLITNDEGGRLAAVKLGFEDKTYIGTSNVGESNEAHLEAIAGATLEAIKKALPIAIDAYVRKVLMLRPEFLSDILLVTMVDLYIDCRKLSLTGCCVCREKDIIPGTARATLDSTNRVVEFFLKKPGSGSR